MINHHGFKRGTFDIRINPVYLKRLFEKNSLCATTTASSSLPASLREEDMIHQIEDRIRQLSNSDKKGMDPSIKSQGGVSVEIYVKEKVNWHHEYF